MPTGVYTTVGPIRLFFKFILPNKHMLLWKLMIYCGGYRYSVCSGQCSITQTKATGPFTGSQSAVPVEINSPLYLHHVFHLGSFIESPVNGRCVCTYACVHDINTTHPYR